MAMAMRFAGYEEYEVKEAVAAILDKNFWKEG